MNREQYIQSLNKGEIGISTYYLYYTLLKGDKVDEDGFKKLFPQFYQLVPHLYNVINNRVIDVMDNHFKVNKVLQGNNILKRY